MTDKMNTCSEFSVTLYADDLTSEITTWRWLPQDHRAQPLYRDGAMPDDVAADFRAQCERAQMYVTDAASGDTGVEVHFNEVAGSREATFDEKLVILDGFVWISRGGGLRPPVSIDDPQYWAGHQHGTGDKQLVNEGEYLTIIKGAVEWADAVRAQEFVRMIESQAEQWDAKAARYRKLGWTDSDVAAEFGSRPVSPSPAAVNANPPPVAVKKKR